MKRFTALLLTVGLLFDLFPCVANGAVAKEEKVNNTWDGSKPQDTGQCPVLV